MEFEWDEATNEANLAKHGIDFRRARVLFDGRSVITIPSQRFGEDRLATIGEIDGLLYTAIWTNREDRIRLISVRRARHEERRKYRSLYS
jgi:hypothetical protein